MFCYLYDMNDIFSIVPFVTPTEMLINQQPLLLTLCEQDTKWCT